MKLVKVGIAMHRRLLALLTLMLVGGVLFFTLPLVDFSRFATAVESDNTVALDNRIDPNRLGRSLAPQIVWTYLEKTGRMNVLGRTVSSLVAGASASLADPIMGELVTPQALVSLLTSAQLNSGNLRIQSTLVPLPKGSMGSLWSVFQHAEYGIGKLTVNLPVSASTSHDQYRVHLELLQWNWKLVAMDLPQNVREQLADELIRRIGS
jgi:Protein of unknown function (DUF2939)